MLLHLRFLISSALLLMCASALFAQSERGTITGVVRDPSSAVLTNAKVIVTNTATNVANTLTTNDAGEYTVPSLPAGEYRVRVEKEG